MAVPLTYCVARFGKSSGTPLGVVSGVVACVLLALTLPVQAHVGGVGFARAVECAGLLHGAGDEQAADHHVGYSSFESAAFALGAKSRLKRSQVRRAILASAGRARRFSLPQRLTKVRACQALSLDGRDFGSR